MVNLSWSALLTAATVARDAESLTATLLTACTSAASRLARLPQRLARLLELVYKQLQRARIRGKRHWLACAARHMRRCVAPSRKLQLHARLLARLRRRV